MTSIDRLYLDTNVFIAMAEGADSISDQLNQLAATQNPGSNFLFSSELSLAELLVHPIRNDNQPLQRMYEGWIQSGGWLTAAPVDRAVLRRSAEIRSLYRAVKLPDAIHLSTALAFQCTHFLTADRRLPAEIELPQDPDERRAPLRLSVLTLEVDIVRGLVERHQLS